MKPLNTLLSASKATALVVGTLVIGCAVAGLVALAGTKYHTDLNSFMQSFRNAGLPLLVLRLAAYGAVAWYWYRWKLKLLADDANSPEARHSARRIEVIALASLAVFEITVWQSTPVGGEL